MRIYTHCTTNALLHNEMYYMSPDSDTSTLPTSKRQSEAISLIDAACESGKEGTLVGVGSRRFFGFDGPEAYFLDAEWS